MGGEPEEDPAEPINLSVVLPFESVRELSQRRINENSNDVIPSAAIPSVPRYSGHGTVSVRRFERHGFDFSSNDRELDDVISDIAVSVSDAWRDAIP